MNEKDAKFQASLESVVNISHMTITWRTLENTDAWAPNRATKIKSLGQEPGFCIFKNTNDSKVK